MHICLNLMMGQETRMTLDSTSEELLGHSLHGYIDGRHQHMELASQTKTWIQPCLSLTPFLLSCWFVAQSYAGDLDVKVERMGGTPETN